MKILKKVQLKICVVLTALFLVAGVLCGLNVSAQGVKAEAAEMPSNVTYIDTEVKAIAYAQHPSQVYFGFQLTVSDYNQFGKVETDWKDDATAAAIYNDYMTSWLTHWKNFPEMNSEGSRFTINYSYWNGAALGNAFLDTVAHRSNLPLLEYGYAIFIPAGTTFPSLTYVYNKCQGTPIMYRTTKDVAFYFNGDTFVTMAYSAALERKAAVAEIKGVNYSNYYEAEVAQVEALVDSYVKRVNVCTSGFQVEDALTEFYAELQNVMTKSDYATLEAQKTEAKAELSAYIASFSATDYEPMDWLNLIAIKTQGETLIESIQVKGEVEVVLAVLKLAADNVITKAEKPAFNAYVETAKQQLAAAFKAELYYAEQIAEGEALIQEGEAAIAEATTYNEVDGLLANYLVKINEIKTAAEVDAEGENTQQPDSSTSSDSEVTEQPKEGCGSVASATGIIFGVAFMAVSMVIKKKADNKDEN